MCSMVPPLSETKALARLVGESPCFRRVLQVIPAVARSSAAVLITGETGTGKELVARAIHHMSDRNAFPFVPVNCGSLSDSLFEDELFGHERGAFTGADRARVGLIAHAEGGTLFLDEVDTLASKAQIALLRVLQDGSFRLIGSNDERHADVRILAASNAPVERLVAAGTFRADLYYRLSVFSVNLPPLRDRKDDIAALADHFLKKHTPIGRGTIRLKPNVREALMCCEWPGNVRELENAIIRGIYLGKTDLVGLEDLGLPIKVEESAEVVSVASRQGRGLRTLKKALVESFEKDYLTRLMSEHRGNISRAARIAGKDRRDLGKLLKKYRLDPAFFRLSGSASS